MTLRVVTLCSAAMACVVSSWAQERFDSAEAAAQAVIDAAARHDSGRLAAIIGPQASGILTSGSPAQDRTEQAEFAKQAQAKHRIEISPMNSGRAILTVGEEDWPFPVPICRKNGKWSFDASGTPIEMRARHIGADELDAIEVCRGYVEAQTKYAAESRAGDGLPQYASRLMSTPGARDGLYWHGSEEALIPEGLARAGWDGLRAGEAKPYHGYYFRILDGQGPDANGGAHNYLVKDKMIGGFGLVAWPAEYGVTGIHTFIVNQDGVVYEKDREPAAGKPAPAITRFDPDRSWTPVD
ncbi:MAG TPA: DUF2950 domain-containing protein [Candidatus Acidoferrales bacterium]|nr:DUF2950 domain-containing protein [Candidatus Acidoferrales bacterium]